MADATQYLLKLEEIVELIIRKVDIHEGLWVASVGMQMGVGNFGPTPDQQFPGVAVTLNNLGIQKIDEQTAKTSPSKVVDAAKVNPMPNAKKKAT
jgi:hypothetical protein